MDFSIILEVLVEKGYDRILLGCVTALILLLLLKKVLPRQILVRSELKLSKTKVFMGEEFEIKVKVTARRKVKVKELAFFIECYTVAPEARGFKKRQSYYFERKVIAKDIPLYRNHVFEERAAMKVPDSDMKDQYLPGTFSSQNRKYNIVWIAGYNIMMDEEYDKVEKSQPLVVFPVSVGW